jgi:putative ABC transport system permease protein
MRDSLKDIQSITAVTKGLQVVLAFIGILTLGIGGVGAMDIMFVPVRERAREIGMPKKAL